MNNGDRAAMPTQSNGGDLFGGLTKREHFAGLAMQALINHRNDYRREYVARHAVDMANLLLKELEK